MRKRAMPTATATLPATGHCSPTRSKNFELHKTCYTHNELVAFAHDWNALGKGKLISNPQKMSVKRLYKELNERYSKEAGCENEVCWIRQSPSMSRNILDVFRPLRSDKWTKQREWLSTTDINNVMQQYAPLHPDFKFLGVFPVDFAQTINGSCIVSSMCNFNVKNLKAAGKTRFGMVINLDKHDQPGSHWVAVFCCINTTDPKYGAFYFDSGGVPPEPIDGTKENPIMDFLKSLKQQVIDMHGPDHKTKFWVRYNTEQKQYKNTECGMFSLLFNILCLEHRDLDYKSVCNIIGDDEFAHQFRKILYTTDARNP